MVLRYVDFFVATSLCSQFRNKVLEAQQTMEGDHKLHTHKKFVDDNKSKSSKAGSLPAREMLYVARSIL